MKLPTMSEIIARYQMKAVKSKKRKTKTVYAYMDGERICDVVQLALDTHRMLDDVKKELKADYPTIIFKVE